MREKAPVFHTLSQVKTFMNEKVGEILHERLTWNTLEEIVKDVLHRRVEDLIYCALGFEWDYHDSSGRARWTLKSYNEEKFTIPRLIREHAEDVAEKNFKKWVKALLPSVEKTFATSYMRKEIVEHYKSEVSSAFYKRLTAFVEEKAYADVEAMFDKDAEKWLEELQLKNPIRLNDIRHLAEDPEDE